MAERFSRSRRVRKRRDFTAAQRAGSRGAAAHFVVLLSSRATSSCSAPASTVVRLGIIASRKVGGAVQRNRAKRLIREWFRKGADVLPPSLDLIVIARSGAAALGLAEATSELDAALRRARSRGASRRKSTARQRRD